MQRWILTILVLRIRELPRNGRRAVHYTKPGGSPTARFLKYNSGSEMIIRKGEVVFELNYIGGLIVHQF